MGSEPIQGQGTLVPVNVLLSLFAPGCQSHQYLEYHHHRPVNNHAACPILTQVLPPEPTALHVLLCLPVTVLGVVFPLDKISRDQLTPL